MTGAVVSTTVTVWLHRARSVQASVGCQGRAASTPLPQWPAVLVTVLRMVIVAVPVLSVAVGASKVQALPNCTVLLVLLVHFFSNDTATTDIYALSLHDPFPNSSVACQVRVASKVLPQWPA